MALSADQVLLVQAELLGRRHFAEAAAALAQQLANRLNGDRASLGWAGKDGMQVVAASYVAEVHARQETARLVAAAMDEAAEQGGTLRHPAPDVTRPCIVLAHEELGRQQGYALCTVPLAHEGRVVGALMMERRGSAFSEAEATQIERVAAFMAPLLVLKYENDLSFARRLMRDVRATLGRMGRDGVLSGRHARTGLAALGVALAGLLLFPFDHQVGAPATLEGSIQRTLTAPADGFLQRVHVRPGDRVAAGQLLAELADQDMQVELRGLEAELAQHENALVSAQARNDRSEFIVSQGRAEATRAQLEVLQQALARSQLRAPFEGVVIKGDLSQSVGAPVERGDELITLAPSSGYRVMIEAEESEVADLKPGQDGRLILAALPAQTMPLRVDRITPLATTEEGRHYFAVYATLQGNLPALRPGMQGFARIEVGQRPVLVDWSRRAFNWARIQLWSWGA